MDLSSSFFYDQRDCQLNAPKHNISQNCIWARLLGLTAFCSWKPPTTATVFQPVQIALFTLALCCQASKKEEQELLVHKLRDNTFVNSPTFQQTAKCEHFPGLFWEISAFPIVDFVDFMTSSH